MKVRIQASEIVRYDQIVEMSAEDFDRLLEARDAGNDEEIVWLVDTHIDNTDVDARSNFELDDVYECDHNGHPLE